jgi:chromosome partitioning protein
VIVTVANRKGGVGKTTTAVFVAHALTEATGAPCTLVDADPLASATQWAGRAAASGSPLQVVVRPPAARLSALATGAPNVVIDTPPDDSDVVAAAVALADIVVIPTSPSALDLSVVESTLALATGSRKPAVVLLTQTRRTRSVASAEKTLRDAGARLLQTHIPLREALAMAFGRPVRQLHGYDLALAELLGALPEQPYSVDAVRQRSARPRSGVRQPISLRPHLAAHPDGHRADHSAGTGAPQLALRAGAIGLGDDEIIERLKLSVARLAT